MPFVVDNSVVVGWYFESQATDYTDRVLDLLAEDIENNLALALEHNLSAYDAAYLDLAIRLRLPIAARDGALREAAFRAGVGLVE